MPVAAAVVGAALSIGAAAAAAAGASTLLVIGLAVASKVLTSLAANAQLAEKQAGMKQTVSGTQAALPVVYGTTEVGGKIIDVRVDEASTDDKILGYVLALAVGSEDGTGINAINEIYFDDRLAIDATGTIQSPFDSGAGLFGGGATIDFAKYQGTDSQTVDSELNTRWSSAWPSTSELKGIAYVRFLLEWHKEQYAGGIPEVRAEIEGQKVFDPRDSTTSFSDNPALCIRDFLLSDRYGFGFDASDLDDQSFIDGANYCEGTSINEPSPRFKCNGPVDTARSLKRNLNELLSSCRGQIIHQGGQLRLHIPQDKTAVAFEIDENVIIGDYNWKRAGVQNTANSVTASFVDSSRDYSVRDVTWPESGTTNNALDSEDAGFENIKEIQLSFTTRERAAKAIAQTTFKESREDASASFVCEEEALQLEVGDVVKHSHANPGWDQKLFWVSSLGLNVDGTVSVGLSEFNSSAYTLDTITTSTPPPGTTLPDPFEEPSVQNLTTASNSSTQLLTPSGDKVPRILAEWDRPAERSYDHAEVFARQEEESDGTAVSDTYKPIVTVDSDEDQEALFQIGDEDELWRVKVVGVSVNDQRDSNPPVDDVTLSTDFVASDLPGTIVDIDLQEDDFDSDGVVEGRMLVDVIASGSYDLQFLTRQGRGTAWTTASNPTGVSEGDPTETQDVELLESQNSFVALDVFKAGTSTKVGRRIIVTFDPDAVANVTDLSIAVDPDDGSLTAEVAGDSDTATIYLTQTTDGSEPTDPTAANADETVAARSGSVTFSGVTVAQSETARVKARGENAATDLAPASTIKADRAKRTGERSSVNLLSADAGPSKNTAGVTLTAHQITSLGDAGLSVGDTISASADVKSDTGADRVRIQIRYLDSGGAIIRRDNSPAVATSTFQRVKVEDSEIPANTATINFTQQNLDTTENSQSRRRMLNRGPVAAPYSQPPSTGDLIGSHTVDVDSAGNVLVSGRRRADVQTVYFTVGVGSGVPADPTAASHDHDVTAQTWEESDTGINATPPTLVVVKAVPELASGSLGPVEIAGASAGPWAGPDLPRLPGDGTSVADVIDRIRDDGRAGQNFAQFDGAFPLGLGKGFEPGTARDGVSESFTVNRNDPPDVSFLPGGGLSFSSSLSGDHGPNFQAANKDADGFTPVLRLQEPAGSIVGRSIASWTDPGSTQDLEANKSQSAEAWDDQYTLRYHVVVTGNQVGGECFGGSMTVGHYYNKGSGWVLDGRSEYSSSCNDFDADVGWAMTVDGMGAGADFGVNHDFGAGVLSPQQSGDAVAWEEATAPADTPATPSGASDVPWIARASS